MGIYLRGKNWCIDFYYQGKRYKESIGPVSKTMAKENLIVLKREVIQGTYKPKRVETPFEKFRQQYLEYSRQNKKPSSSLRDESSLKHLMDFFDGKKLSEITAFLVERYKAKRKPEGAKEATINREMACLRHMFTMAITWGKAESNPVKEVRFLREPKEKTRILSPEEEESLLAYVRSHTKSQHLEAIIVTALNTGMRKGEILNLRWEDVDLRQGYITVVKTKNDEIRRIPLNKQLTDTLKSVKSLSAGGQYVFGENGKPHGDVKTGWRKAVDVMDRSHTNFHPCRKRQRPGEIQVVKII
jgi:integrase